MSELAEDCICPAEHATCPYHGSEALCEDFPVNSHQHDDYRATSLLREQRKTHLKLMQAGSCSFKANGQTCEVGDTPGTEQTFQVNRTPELDHHLTINKEKPTREPQGTMSTTQHAAAAHILELVDLPYVALQARIWASGST
jgi:hypothetical protein